LIVTKIERVSVKYVSVDNRDIKVTLFISARLNMLSLKLKLNDQNNCGQNISLH